MHYETLCSNIELVNNNELKVKINTVVTKKNAQDIIKIGHFLRRFHPSRWSLYQYWPLGFGLKNNERFIIGQSEFLAITEQVEQQDFGFTVECNTISCRDSTYLFVTHSGVLYVLHPNSTDGYLRVGKDFQR